MFHVLKSLFQVSAEPEEQISYQRAVAALMMEVVMADDTIDENEVQQVKRFLREATDLGDSVEEVYEEKGCESISCRQ